MLAEARLHGVSATSAFAAATSEAPSWVPTAAIAASACSVLIALASLLVSRSTRNLSARALHLAQQQEDRRSAALDVRLRQGLSLRTAAGDRWICLEVLAVNPSDRDGTIVASDLHVSYRPPSGDLLVVKVEHGGVSSDWPAEVEPLALPTLMRANGAVAGWLVYRLATGLVPEGSVQGFDALIHDSRGLSPSLQVWGLREVT